MVKKNQICLSCSAPSSWRKNGLAYFSEGKYYSRKSFYNTGPGRAIWLNQEFYLVVGLLQTF
jgi:hypothetical protein